MTVSFAQATLDGDIGIANPSALQWGPDGKLYVASRFGDIAVVEVARAADGGFTVVSSTIIDAVRLIPNHDDDGTLAGADDDGIMRASQNDPDSIDLNQRQVTGLVVGGTAEAPVIYVTSSDPRIGAGLSGTDTGLDTNSGTISRLTPDGSGGWDKVDIVRGLPRSEENHATNGLSFSADGTKLLVAQGGNTNNGAPSTNLGGQQEYALSGAILEIDLGLIATLEATGGVKTAPAVPGFPPQRYIYDLPTLDDPTRANDANGADLPGGGVGSGDPFGGNDGLNQAKLVVGGPVRIYSPGYRNPYDVLVTEDGRVFTYDNGPNTSWGGALLDQFGREFVGAPGQIATNLPNQRVFDGIDVTDQLHEISGPGYYGGHPNATRAFGADAGLLETPGSGVVGAELLPSGELPIDFGSVVDPSLLNPIEGRYLTGAETPGVVDTGAGSVNGLAEFTYSGLVTDTEGNLVSLRGAILAADYNGEIYLIDRYADGDGDVETMTVDGQIVAAGKQVIALSSAGGPLGIDTLGDGGPFAGTIWITELGGNRITILTPGGDVVAPDDDLDDDGLDNVIDRFALDASNGFGTLLGPGTVLRLGFDAGVGAFPGTEGGIGFTGAMVNGIDAYADGGLIDRDNLILGGAANTLGVKAVGAGSAFQRQNAQRDALQLGVTLDQRVEQVSFTATLDNWLIGTEDTTVPLGGFPSAGIFLGSGDQDNYVKLVLAGRGATTPQAMFEQALEVGGESSRAIGGGMFAADALLAQADPSENMDWVQLRLTLDVATGTIVPSWRYGRAVDRDPASGALPPELTIPFIAGNPVIATGDLLAAIEGSLTIDGLASGLAVGVIGTSRAGTPFTADYDGIDIVATGARDADGSALVQVNPGSNNLSGGSTFNANSVRIVNSSAAGVGITRVEFRLAADGADGAFLSLLRNIAFDPATDTDGEPAGDALGKDFTRDNGSVGAFDVTAALSRAFDGGYKVLTLDFAGFDPGETLSFSLDIDPVSTKLGDGQAANQAGKISGIELTGVPVTVTFSDGSVRTAELFSDGSLAGASTTVGDALAAAPVLSVAGLGGPQGVVAGLQQTVTISGGVAGGRVRLVVAEAAAYRVEPDNGYAFAPFEANKVVAVRSQFVTLDANGAWTGVVALSDGPDAEDGYNLLSAAMVDESGRVIGLVSDLVTVRVAANQPPALAVPLPDRLLLAGRPIDFALAPGSFADPDAGQAPTLSATSLPGGLTFDPATGRFGGSVAAGLYDVTVRATDPAGASASDTFELAVALGLTEGKDKRTGGSGADLLDGLGQADKLKGGGGNDLLWGGTGDDKLDGGNGADRLTGGEGKDKVGGGAGYDTLVGGLGIDKLTGGGQADAFRFLGAAEGGDTLSDFESGADRIELSASGFGGGLVAGTDLVATGRFVSNGSGTATVAGLAQFVFETDSGLLWFDVDGAGGAARVLVLELAGGGEDDDGGDDDDDDNDGDGGGLVGSDLILIG